MLINDWTVFRFHNFDINQCREVVMIHKKYTLGKYWKMFATALNSLIAWKVIYYYYYLYRELQNLNATQKVSPSPLQ